MRCCKQRLCFTRGNKIKLRDFLFETRMLCWPHDLLSRDHARGNVTTGNVCCLWWHKMSALRCRWAAQHHNVLRRAGEQSCRFIFTLELKPADRFVSFTIRGMHRGSAFGMFGQFHVLAFWLHVGGNGRTRRKSTGPHLKRGSSSKLRRGRF